MVAESNSCDSVTPAGYRCYLLDDATDGIFQRRVLNGDCVIPTRNAQAGHNQDGSELHKAHYILLIDNSSKQCLL